MLSRPSQGEVPVSSASTGNALDSYISGASIQKPTMAHSALLSALSGFGQMVTLGSDIGSAISGERSQGNISMHAALNSINTELANVNTIGQKATDFVSNVAGSTLGLLPIGGEAIFAGAGKLATPLIGRGVAKIAPTLAEKTIPKLTFSGIKKETLGQFGARTVQMGTSFAGFMAPQEIEESYDEKTNQFNYGKAAIGVAANGAFGALIPSTQYLAGLLFGRLGRKAIAEGEEAVVGTPTNPGGGTSPSSEMKMTLGKESRPISAENLKRLDKALQAGEITTKQHAWYKDALANPNDPEIAERASAILAEEGHTPDASRNKVFVKLMTEADTKNINNVTTDQLFSQVDESLKTAASDFISHGRIDAMRENPEVANGLDGWIDHIDNELAKKPETLAAAENISAEGLTPNSTMSQKQIYDRHKMMTPEEAHPSQHPYTVPERVQQVLSHEENLGKAKTKKDSLVKEKMRQGKSIIKQIMKTKEPKYKAKLKAKFDDLNVKFAEKITKAEADYLELKNNPPTLHSPQEELAHIKDRLLTNRILTKNFRASKEYHRLVDLAHYWPAARKLLDRIHLEDAHNAQLAYRNIMKAYSDLIKSNLLRLANKDRVTDYLKSRIESNTLKANLNKEIRPSKTDFTTTKESTDEVTKPRETKTETRKGKEKGEKSTDEDVLSAQREEAEASSAEESKEAYEASDKRLRQFKNSGKALENLISCVMGSTNGNI